MGSRTALNLLVQAVESAPEEEALAVAEDIT